MGGITCQGISLPSRLSSLAQARQIVDEYARKAGFSERARAEICLAAHEAISNALLHGSPAGEADTVDLQLAMEDSALVVTVRDYGPFVRLPRPSLPDPATFAGHGRGLFLMCHLMDEVRFDWNGGTIVRMVKRRHPEP